MAGLCVFKRCPGADNAALFVNEETPCDGYNYESEAFILTRSFYLNVGLKKCLLGGRRLIIPMECTNTSLVLGNVSEIRECNVLWRALDD